MQYASGGELYEYVSERKALTDNEARRIFRQIATAVYYIHKVGTYVCIYPAPLLKCCFTVSTSG